LAERQVTLTSANGEKYVGEYKDGKKHGQGTFTSADGGKYVGEYKDGKMHGKGTLFDPMLGTKTTGKWEEGFFVTGSN